MSANHVISERAQHPSTSTRNEMPAMGNRFTGLGQSLERMGHNANGARQQAFELIKAVKVVNK